LTEKLLRLRKDLPTTLPCALSQQNWERLLVPLFHQDNLVTQSLVNLGSTDTIKRTNEELRSQERYVTPIKGSVQSTTGRPIKRHGTYLAADSHGLLVVDMTPGSLGEEVIEFKPKWLIQSPSAPANSKRCRQCARQAQTDAAHAQHHGITPISQNFCPLDLISKSSKEVNLAVSKIESNPTKARRLTKWLQSTTLLSQLRDVQESMDPKGVFTADLRSEKFCLAMTLRDCTVFLRLPANASDDKNIEARLGDLDLKSPDKAEYWMETERKLIDEGWYQGTESVERRQPTYCQISRK
jgi:inositol-pentakisphosphate 2-kinase